MDSGKLKILANLLNELAEEAEGEESLEQETPQSNFYFNPDVFMGLHTIDSVGLRKLVTPNLDRLRKIQGG